MQIRFRFRFYLQYAMLGQGAQYRNVVSFLGLFAFFRATILEPYLDLKEAERFVIQKGPGESWKLQSHLSF